MLVNADVKSLEIFTAAFLSQDKVLLDELRNNVDIHTRNQTEFGLPTRLIAKVLGFRILYGGSAYSFTHDPDFTSVSKSETYWQRAIDKFYDKYSGIHDWHNRIQEEVLVNGRLTMPTGRVYTFQPVINKKGEYKWPTTNIKNYPVQGTGSDLVTIARVSLFNRMKKAQLRSKLLATVHDSILLDCPTDEVDTVVKMLHSVANDVPNNFQRLFGVVYNLPFLIECEVGNQYYPMESYHAN